MNDLARMAEHGADQQRDADREIARRAIDELRRWQGSSPEDLDRAIDAAVRILQGI